MLDFTKVALLALTLAALAAICSHAQTFEAVLIDGEGGVHKANRGMVEVGYKEELKLEVRMPTAQNAIEPQPLACLIDYVQVVLQSSDKTKIPKLKVPDDTLAVRMDLKIAEIASGEGIDVTTFNVEALAPIVRVGYRVRPPQPTGDACGGLAMALPSDQQVDVFSLNVRNYGLHILVDVQPVSSGTNAIWDVLGGVLSTLNYASVDYPYLFGESEFKQIMASAPILFFESRRWYKSHWDLEAVVVRASEGSEPSGKGAAVGLFRPKGGRSAFKVGFVRLETEEADGTKEKHTKVFGAVSVPTIGSWLSRKRR